jgi:hypothetical protein
MSLSNRFFAILIITLAFVHSAKADVVYVNEVGGEGVDSATKASIQSLIESSVNQVSGKHTLTEKRESAKTVLRGQLLKLGDAYILTLDKMVGGKVTFSSKMKSTTLEDMDTVASRLVEAVLNEKALADTATTQSITRDEETRGTRRYEATRQWRFSFGPAWSNNLNADGPGTVFGLGYIWGLDPYVDLKLVMTFYNPREDGKDDADFSNLAIGVNYFFDLNKNSPYLTSSLGYAGAASSDGGADTIFDTSADEADGWALTGGVGYKFFRTSTVNVGFEASYTYLFDKTDKTKVNPSTTFAEIVVYY